MDESAASRAESSSEEFKQAKEIIPHQALRAIMGMGLTIATGWSLRAREKRTTILLIWGNNDNELENLQYRRNSGGKQRRRQETEPNHSTPPQQLTVTDNPASTTPIKDVTVQGDAVKVLQEQIAALSSQIQAISMTETAEVANVTISTRA
ncbi:hypothetical protein ACJMK2_005345 [Sinanodonta woodiana]|uniref:Uncharacterized protein n=1 Tax=Sinanodonta woodiana TaxID=1069815 RepID=A0ABD3VPR5_SINWO